MAGFLFVMHLTPAPLALSPPPKGRNVARPRICTAPRLTSHNHNALTWAFTLLELDPINGLSF